VTTQLFESTIGILLCLSPPILESNAHSYPSTADADEPPISSVRRSSSLKHSHETEAADSPSESVLISEDPEEQRLLLSPGVRILLGESLLDGTFEPVVDLQSETFQKLKRSLRGPWAETLSVLAATDEWTQKRRYVEDSLEHLIDNRCLTLAAIGDRVAGVAGFEQIGNLNGSEVFEIKHVTVLPEFRGHGISSLLLCNLIRRVSETNKNACLLSYTKSPSLIHSLLRVGAVEITPEVYSAIDSWHNESDYQRTLNRRVAKQLVGWKALIVDLRERGSSLEIHPTIA
jgi:GNAT superfamily N-acetyltransferase